MFSENKQLLIIFVMLGISIPILVIVASSLFQEETRLTEELTDDQIRDFNFAVLGDFHCLPETNKTINKVLDKNPELILGLGDYSYTPSMDCWFDLAEPILERIKPAIGNHDVDNELKYEQIKNKFNLTKQYYSFNYENIHFIVISSEIPFDENSEQYQFVKNDLMTSSSDPEIDWMIVYGHTPLYWVTNTSSNFVIRDTYHPIFEEYDVDLYFGGHFHNYQRSYPLRYHWEDSSDPHIAQTGATHYYNPSGQIFATVGTGGAVLHDFKGKAPYMVTQYLGFGFLNIEIKNDGKVLDAKFLDSDGFVRDQFVIEKFDQPKTLYDYEPYLILNGSNYYDVPSNETLQLDHFSVGTWFKTDKIFLEGTSGYLVNKGGTGSEKPGENMNYGLWMNSNERIRADFETINGTSYGLKSSKILNDDLWHYVVTTFDGERLRLYIDGVQGGTTSAPEIPDNTGNQPIRIGANSLKASEKNQFTGFIDEIRVWNRSLTGEEITKQYFNGIFDTKGQILYLPFD